MRALAANLGLTLDGRYDGPGDFAVFAPYVISEIARDLGASRSV
ncbi:hypothetical protein [Sphaerisporangium fuscum]|nr:hypothetical protein [Sphaerisporangium fuscum]